MRCDICNGSLSHPVQTRTSNDSTKRIYRCTKCGNVFHTIELKEKCSREKEIIKMKKDRKFKIGDELYLKGCISDIDSCAGYWVEFGNSNDGCWMNEEELEEAVETSLYSDTTNTNYNEGFNSGEKEAWKIIDILTNQLTDTEIHNIFGAVGISYIVRNFSYPVIKERIEKHMEECHIKIGDEVYGIHNERVGVVTHQYICDESYNIIWENGEHGNLYLKDLKKTGRTFPQLVEMFNAMTKREEGEKMV